MHASSGERVALKTLWPDQRERLRPLVLREVEATARLDHPGVVWVHDFGDDERGPWVALELLSGGSLAAPARGHAVDTYRALHELVVGLLSALAHAHARDVLHRDLKPQNVLFGSRDDPRPGPKLVDFGIAAVGRGVAIAGATPAYAAPEQLQGGQEGPWTDLFAFGALVWSVVCGGPPSARPSFDPRLPVPEGFEDWLRDLSAPRISDRTASASAALEAFRVLGRPAEDGAPDRRTWDDAPEVARNLRPHPRRSPASLRLFGLRTVPLVGRASELAELGRWVVTPNAAQVCVVTGPAGIGKTHLVRHFRAWCREKDLAYVLPVEPHRAQPLARAVRDARIPGLEPETDEAATEALLRWVPRAGRPVVAVVDVREGRPGGPALVGSLARVRGLKVLTTERSRLPDAGRSVVPDPRQTLTLGPVDPVALLRRLGLSEGSLSARLAERAGGRPGLAVALLGDLVRSERLRPGERGYVLPEGEELPTFDAEPLAAARAVASHLPASPALSVAAVLGRTVDWDVWAEVLARLAIEPGPAELEVWLRSGLVRRSAHHLHLDDPLIRAVLEERVVDPVAVAAAAADATRDRPERAADHAEYTYRAGRLAEALPKLLSQVEACRLGSRDRAWHLVELAEAALRHHPTLDPEGHVRLQRACLWVDECQVERALHEASLAPPGRTRTFLHAQILGRLGRPRAALRELLTLTDMPAEGGYASVLGRAWLEAGDVERAGAVLDGAPVKYDSSFERAVLALVTRDAARFRSALADASRLRRPGSMWPEVLEASGAALGLVEVSAPPDFDGLATTALAKGLGYMHSITAVAATTWAARHAPDDVPRALAAATESVAMSGARFRMMNDLLVEAARAAPEHADGLLSLATTQLPDPEDA